MEQELEEVEGAVLGEEPEEWSANPEMSFRTRLLLQEGHAGCRVEEERTSWSYAFPQALHSYSKMGMDKMAPFVFSVERDTGVEPATSSLGSWHSTS